MHDWVIEPLSRLHQKDTFCCGHSSLDNFIRLYVSQYEKRRLGRTYVAVPARQKRVAGFYTLSSGLVAFQNLPKRAAKSLPKHPIPVILLARLAVDNSVRGQGLGALLLRDALGRCLDLSTQLGVFAVEVDAIDQSAKLFYEKYGFVPLTDNPLHLFLAIASIENAQ